MSNEIWAAVDDYVQGLFMPEDPILANTLTESSKAGLPNIAVSPAQGKLLTVLARSHGAKRILEIGTLGGYSTICLARALPHNGTIMTLEYDPKHAEVAQANIDRAGLADQVSIRVGRAQDTLRQLVAEGHQPFDLIFIDADKVSYPTYLEWSLKLSHPGTLIIADNVVRDGRILDTASDDVNIQGARSFNELLAANPGVDATIIQTVGSKGYDGFAIAWVNSPAS